MRQQRLVYQGRLLRLLVKKERLPNGVTVELETVEHPGAALVVPFLSRDRVIFIRQLRPVIKRYLFELPAGTFEKGEAPRACARREIIEETGYAARGLKRLGVIFPVPGYSTERIFIYRATGLCRKKKVVQPDEIMRTRIFTRAQVHRLFREGRIVDAKTICALGMCGWLD